MDWNTLAEWALAIIAWLSGEVGRIYVAGAAGGLVRWFSQERRRLADGAVAVVTGVIAANYFPPLLLGVLEFSGFDTAGLSSSMDSTNFLCGLFGMSIAKWVTAIVEMKIFGNVPREAREDREGGDDA